MTARMKNTASSLDRLWQLPRGVIALSTAVAVILLIATPTHAQFFEWTYGLGDPVHDGVIPVPILSNDSGAELAAFLAGQAVPSVRVLSPLNATTVANFFNGEFNGEFNGQPISGLPPIANIFADFEPENGGPIVGVIHTATLVSQISTTISSGATIGQYSLDPSSNAFGYGFAGVNTASPNLYPGSPTFGPPNAVAPNIRSGLFTQPLIRLSQTIAATPVGDSVLPYSTRFNITGSSLINLEHEGMPAWETTDQMLSRGDYKALIAHYRMRGSDGVVAFLPGVVGYTQDEFLQDTQDGWNLVDSIYNNGDVTPVSLDTSITLTGPSGNVNSSFEEVGAAWSGVMGQIPSGQEVLAILLSNLSDGDLDILLPSTLAGHGLNTQEFTISSNDHFLLAFALNLADEWQMLGPSGEVFADDERGGIGIPEPASLVMLGVGCLLIGLPRSCRRVF